MYNSSKLGNRDVSVLRIEDNATNGKTKFSLGTMLGLVAHAAGFVKEKIDPPSKQKALGKKRPRLFLDVDLEAEQEGESILGSMDEVDLLLTRAKREGQ